MAINKAKGSLLHHLTAVKGGKRRFENAFQGVVRLSSQILGFPAVVYVGGGVPKRPGAQAGPGATVRHGEPGYRVAERDVAAPDAVVLRPFDIDRRYQQCSGWACQHRRGSGQAAADDHLGFRAVSVTRLASGCGLASAAAAG